jgi:Flp pilus assembly protein TadG
VLVVVVLVPLVLGVLQVSLVLLVRNTLTAAASDGARYAATVGRGPSDGAMARAEPHEAGPPQAR